MDSVRLRGWLGEGLVSASRLLSEAHGTDAAIHVVDARCYPLSEFGEMGLHGDLDDVVAGTLVSCRGDLSGAAIFVMEPEQALAFARAADPDADAIDVFLDLGRYVLSGAFTAASDVIGLPTQIGEPSLIEYTMAGCLLATHAPPDTVVVGAKLLVEVDGVDHDAFCHLLLDAKIVSVMLRTLEG